MSRQDDLQNLITENTRRLQKLKVQQARKGIDTDPHILLEIEDIEETIAQLQAELAELETKQGFISQPKVVVSSAGSPSAPPPSEPIPKPTALRAQARIFLCHASEDKPQVMELYRQLQVAGYHPWMDKFDLLPGQQSWREIEKIICNPYNLVLVCFSNNSITKRGVLQQEIRWALDILERMPEESIYLIPIRLETCPVPAQLSALHWVDLFERDGFEHLIRTLDLELNRRQVASEPKQRALIPYAPARSAESELVSNGNVSSSPVQRLVIAVGTLIVVALTVVCTVLLAVQSPSSPTIIPTNTPFDTLSATPVPTSVPTLTPSSLPQIITASDGAPMVLVPAGSFKMGSSQGASDEQPVHEVVLNAFYIDQYEVTNTQYAACVDVKTCDPPAYTSSYSREEGYYGNLEYADYPVIFVNWQQARAYCAWRGGQLPTEAQWEKAARGDDQRPYPWGEEIVDCNRANIAGCAGDTRKVGSYPAGVSPYGVYDMAGNVWEWVADWYDDEYYKNSPSENPLGPLNGTWKVLRGGSWYDGDKFSASTSDRDSHHRLNQYGGIGFRCAADVP